MTEKDTGSKYERTIFSRDGHNSITVDVYNVLDAFDVKCSATQHAIKKLLCAGIRGKNDKVGDLTEAIDAIKRAITLSGHRESDQDDEWYYLKEGEKMTEDCEYYALGDWSPVTNETTFVGNSNKGVTMIYKIGADMTSQKIGTVRRKKEVK